MQRFRAALSLAPALLCLPQNSWYETNHTNAFAWPSAAAPGAFGRTIAGQFREPHIGSAVVVAGGVPYLVWAPDAHASVYEIAPTTVTDIATLPGAPGSVDSILACTATGLKQFVYLDESSGFISPTTLGDAAWNNARRVIVRDMDGQYGPDIVGISADGMSGLILPATATAFASTTTTFALNAAADDVVAMDYFVGADPELFFLNAQGLHLHLASGTFLAEFASSAPGGAIELLEYAQSEPALERLAWITAEAGGSGWVLEVFDRDAADTPLALDIDLNLGANPIEIDPTSMTAVDFDGDGNDDLAIAHTTFRSVPILLNQLGTQNFQLGAVPDTHVLINYDANPGASAATHAGTFAAARLPISASEALIAPLDDAGYLVAAQLPGELEIAVGTAVVDSGDAGASMTTGGGLNPGPGITPAGLWDIAGIFLAQPDPNPDPPVEDIPGFVQLYFDVFPWELIQPGANYNRLQVVVWEQKDPQANEYIERVAQHNYLYSFPGGSPSTWASDRVLKIPLDDAMDLVCPGWKDRRHKYLQLRLVRVDSSDSILYGSESLYMGLAMDEPKPTKCVKYLAASLEYFLADFNPLPTEDEVRISVEGDYEPGTGGPGSSLTGGVVIVDYIPPIRPNRSPHIPAPTNMGLLPIWP